MSYFSWVGMPLYTDFDSTQPIEFLFVPRASSGCVLPGHFQVSIAFFA
jgi:hypothetical protein